MINKEGNGLSVQIFTGLSDTEYNYLYEPDYKGVHILIDDQANFLIKNDGVLNSGSYSKTMLTKTLTQSMPAPYGNCLNDEQIRTRLANEMRRLGYNYSRKNCITFCEQEQTINQLGCYDMRLPAIFKAPPCNTQAEFNNISNLIFDYTLCYNDCPFECSTYSLSTSYANYPTYDFYVTQYLKNTDFYENMFEATNIIFETYYDWIDGVFVAYEDLRYTEITDQAAFEIMDIFENDGGTLGLFLGFSILSFVELLDLVHNILMVSIRVYRAKKGIKMKYPITHIHNKRMTS